MDVIDDAEMAIDSYVGGEDPDEYGLRYLLIYGVLQVLTVEQQALRDLVTALQLPDNTYENSDLEDIRKIRHRATGHPTSMRGKKEKKGVPLVPPSSHFIVRHTMNKGGFTLIDEFENGHTNREEVNLMAEIQKQKTVVRQVLQDVFEALEKKEQEHRLEFRDEKLADAFPPTLDYLLTKISESVPDIHSNRARMGSAALPVIKKAVLKFEQALKKRGILDQHNLMTLFEQLTHPFEQLDSYLNQHPSRLDEKSAPIYAYYLRDKVKELCMISQEIDEEYAEDVAAEAGGST